MFRNALLLLLAVHFTHKVFSAPVVIEPAFAVRVRFCTHILVIRRLIRLQSVERRDAYDSLISDLQFKEKAKRQDYSNLGYSSTYKAKRQDVDYNGASNSPAYKEKRQDNYNVGAGSTAYK
jgi:hypothetical protein